MASGVQAGEGGTSPSPSEADRPLRPDSSQCAKPPAEPLGRYYFRSILGVVGPVGTFLLYVAIYVFWLLGSSTKDEINYGAKNGYLLFYLWFIICIVGIGLGEYGLSGAEAGMVTSPLWKPRHTGVLMLQADKTWSGPGGWLKAMKAFWRWRQIPPRCWTVLSMVTLLSYTALPLSGLTLELSPG